KGQVGVLDSNNEMTKRRKTHLSFKSAFLLRQFLGLMRLFFSCPIDGPHTMNFIIQKLKLTEWLVLVQANKICYTFK
ncbi:hypothetical protein, partial [Tetragenococcus halophilus]|uniref:hypothetical protein n=1 Tax=Tetragenococcus halophilus TaxID=51669 RepID=UPI00295EC1B2